MAKPESDLTPKAKKTRAALVGAARMIIGKKGIAGTTVMEVCDAAGVGRTSFYNYFGDMDSLIQTVAIVAAGSVRSEFNVLHQDTPRGIRRLERCLRMVLRMAVDDRETALLLTSLAQETEAVPNLLRGEIEQELQAAAGGNENGSLSDRTDTVSRFLTLSTLSICREIALGKIPGDQIDAYVDVMIGASRAA